MKRGYLIVLEGVDGSGTTTQADQLKTAFASRNIPVHVTAQPSSGPVGMLIRQILSRRVVSIDGAAPGWTTMSLLFAGDRQDLQENEINPNLENGVNVICDRYVHSSVIYQGLSADQEGAAQWILEINKHIRAPDLVIYLKISPDEASRRRRARSDKTEIFDDDDFQRKLIESYDRLDETFADSLILTLDAQQPIDEIAKQAWAAVEKLMARGATP